MICCVCGFRSHKGVLWGFTGPVRMVIFACESCFPRPYLFFPCKRYERPTWLITLTLDRWLREAVG